jgi:hypothetical protein
VDLLFPAEQVIQLHEANPMIGGREHRVAGLPELDLVLKDADVQALATESIFDYLTDLMLSNHYFDDEIQLLGGYDLPGRFHLLSTQPFVDGSHPDWLELKPGLVAQGLLDPFPGALGGNFILQDEILGPVDVFDLHVNNVIRDASGWLNPIDAHFYFDDRATRILAMQRLKLL